MPDFWDHVKAKGAGLLSAVAAVESVDGAAVAGFGSHQRVQITAEVVAAVGGAVADTLDLFVDRSADGVVWTNVVHFTQILGNAPAKRFLATLDHATTTPGVAVLDYSADAAAAAVRPLVLGDYLRARAVIVVDSDPDAEWEFSIVAHGE